jgi:hypothetical protein
VKKRTGDKHPGPDRKATTMSTATTKELTMPEKGRNDDESIRDNQRVAWYARGDGGVYYIDEADTPVRIGEVYELVSGILKHAPFDSFNLTEECVVEATNHRAWPGLLALAMSLDDASGLYDEARSW